MTSSRDRRRVYAIVRKALDSGTLVKGDCEIGLECVGRVEAHHDDYTNPLDVRWLCHKHHVEHHRAVDQQREQCASQVKTFEGFRPCQNRASSHVDGQPVCGSHRPAVLRELRRAA